MTKTTVDALSLLKDQHDDVLSLMEKIERASAPAQKLALFTEMADKLAAHATIEEKIFYPFVKMPQTEKQLLEASEEHLAAKRVLADMVGMDVTHEHFAPKLSVLRESIRHHAREEEEGKLFPLLRKQLDADTLAGLGNQMLAMFEELMTKAPRKNVKAETHTAPTI